MDREPFDDKFCKYMDCVKRHGNKCRVKECIYNHKWIIHWGTFGVYPPNEEV